MMKILFSIQSFLLAIFLSVGTFGFSQLEFPEDKVSAKFTVEQNGCEATITAKITVVPKWHINAVKLPKGSFLFPTSLKVIKGGEFTLVGATIEPKPHYMRDEMADEDLFYHEGTFSLKQKIKISAEKDFTAKGEFTFQTCNDVRCLPDFTMPFSVNVKGCPKEVDPLEEPIENTVLVPEDNINSDSIEKANAKTVVVPNDDDDREKLKEEKEDKKNSTLWRIFILSFLSGLAALLTPCVFPMIPMTVSFFTKQSKTKAAGIKNAVIYGVSIIAIYILLGTVVTAVFGSEVLNEMSTNPTFNIVFFLILVIFAVSFLGAFEIRMPSKWVNKADSRADKGGLIGIFFMALALALVSFSCTGPIVGTLLVQAASEGGIAPFVGMFGFSFALALPFGLFAAFPGWMNTLPKSGGWLNTVKVVLGFLELALAFKFLSNADLSLQSHMLEREIFLAIWIAIFAVLAIYLFGWIRMPHDSPLEHLSVGRTLFGTLILMFVIYMIPGMFGAPLKLISAFPPPMSYSESPTGFGGSSSVAASSSEHVEGMHLGPQGIQVFHDFDLAQAYAFKVGKPLFVDFTGHNCVNCRRMEQSVWGEPGVIDMLRNDVVIVSLHVDERIDLPADQVKEVEIAPGRMKTLRTTGDKWMYKQIKEYKVTAQPYYIMQGPNGEDLANKSADYEHHSNPKDFRKWLEEGLKLYDKAE
jgi:thiol:disulfide interchange protein|tara:strand:+ start:1670 stop:3760 length:2091 start_codon:yes stop_codon:yes gene_type:complete